MEPLPIVHIIPVGEHDPRVVQLIHRKFPVRAYFLRSREEDVDEQTNAAIKSAQQQYEKVLKDGGAQTAVVETNYLDYRHAFLDLLTIIKKEEGNEIIINLHGGAREVNVIAGQIATLVGGLRMFWLPKYASASVETQPFVEVIVLPRIPEPRSAEAQVLTYLLEKKGEVVGNYKEIVKGIRRELGQPLAKTVDASRMTLSKTLERLERWKHATAMAPLVMRERTGRRTKITFTPTGEFTAEIIRIRDSYLRKAQNERVRPVLTPSRDT
jgi:hypothetical protein